MKKKLITLTVVAVAVATSGYVLYRRAHAKRRRRIARAAVERGNLESTVSATGALGAVRTVQVGTQVSGQISAIYVDFNSKVKKGQLHRAHRPDAAAAGRSRMRRPAWSARRRSSRRRKAEYDRNKIAATTRRSSPRPSSTRRSSTISVAQGEREVGADRARQGAAESGVHDRSTRRSTASSSSATSTSARRSPRASPRRSSSSSRTICRRCRSSRRSTRATSARSRTVSR